MQLKTCRIPLKLITKAAGRAGVGGGVEGRILISGRAATPATSGKWNRGCNGAGAFRV